MGSGRTCFSELQDYIFKMTGYKKEESLSHTLEESQSIETIPEPAQMSDFIDKDCK